MNQDRLARFIAPASTTIVDAMGRIDNNAKGLLFVVDSENTLIGCVSDGDIRRWIIKNGSLDAPIEKAMNRSPKYLRTEASGRAVSFMRQKKITAVPIISDDGKVEDVILLAEASEDGGQKPKGNLRDVPVVVMAGGKGTRLYPYTKILPKPLIPIGDTPIVERIIDKYVEYGIRKFYMTVNYRKGMIKSYFADLNPVYEIAYVEEPKPLGTGGSIKLIEDKFDRPLFVTNCDALIEADYADLYAYHIRSGNVITVVSALKNIVVPYGVLNSKENGEVIDMEEKPKHSYFINTGMYVINPEMIQMIPDDEVFHMPQLVNAAMDSGMKVGMYPISEDSFLDMGEFSEMKRMEEKLHLVSEQ